MSETSAFNEDRTQGYDDRVARMVPGYDVLHGLSELILSAELPGEASVLIGGAGTGKEILEWAPRNKGWTFLGVDPSEAMIATAKEKLKAAPFKDRVQLSVGAIEKLPAEETFDAATLLLVLHFLKDNGEKEELLTAIADRLKPGAPILMATMFGDPATTRYKRMFALTASWALAQGMDPAKVAEVFDLARTDLHVVSEDRIKNLFRYAGFIDVQRIYQALPVGLWLARTPR